MLVRWKGAVAGGLALLVVAAAVTFGVVQGRRLGSLRADLADARADVAQLEAQLAEARAEAAGTGDPDPAAAPSDPVPADPPAAAQDPFALLEELLGSLGGAEGLEDLLGEGLGEGLGEDLDGAAAVAACVGVPSGDPIPDADALTQIAATTERVEELRGHAFSDAVDPELLAPAEVAERLAAAVEEEYSAEEADLDRRILAALRAMPEDVDLRELQQDLLGDQVAGYYDDETGDLVVRTADPSQPLDALELTSLAHELGHALVDDAVGLPDLGADGSDGDADLAALAVVEGDAVILQTQFQTSALSPLDLLEAAAGAGATDGLEGIPAYLRANLLFPYTDGAGFVCGHQRAGGWEAVDRLVAEPPRTTAEILFPERYPAPPPADLDDPPALGDGWTQADARSFGAADLLWLLEAPGDDPDAAVEDARDRTRGWAAGEIVLSTRGPDSALAVRIGQTAGEADLCGTLQAFVDAAYDDLAAGDAGDDADVLRAGDDQAVALLCLDGEVRLGIAPDVAAATTLVS